MTMKLKPSVCLTLASALALPAQVLAQAAPAQPSTPTAEERPNAQVMEAFTVTGSNIRRMDQEKALPVTIMDIDDLSARAALTPAELFDTLSIGGPITLDEGNALGADARGDNTSINLRGIGSGNTLVLLNGRRLPPHPISQAESGVPSLSTNINNLPSSAIGRIEILRDGASAIYGTDAAAGVVNSLTRRNYDGLALRGLARITQHGGANEYTFEVTDGRNFNAGRSNLLLTFEYYHRDLLKLADRDFSKNLDLRLTRKIPAPWDGKPVVDANGTVVIDNDFDNRLSDDSSNFGNFVRGNYDSTGAFIGSRPAGNRGIVTASGSNNMTTGTGGVFYLIPLVNGTTGFRQTLPSHNLDDYTVNWFYNLNDHTVALPKSDRATMTANLTHELANDITFFADILAYNARSVTGRAPNSIDAATDHNLYLSADNPFNPFGTRFYHPTGANNADGTPRLVGDAAQVQIAPSTGVIPRDFRARRVVVKSQAYRGVFGLRGKSGDWNWESAILYGRNGTRDQEHNTIRESRLRAALTSADPTKAFNPFGYTFRLVPQAGNTANPYLIQVDREYSNTPELMNSLYDTFTREGRTQLASWDARFSGSVFDGFWGGPIGVAFGGEFRWESYKDWRPPYAGLNPADAPFNGNPNDPSNLFFGPSENDFIAVSPNVNLYADRTIGAAYAETLIPFVGRRNAMTGIKALELTLAGRVERYSQFGRTAKPKIGVLYRASDWLMVRGSTSGSFRAPNLVQTNTSPLQRSGDTFNDPYRAEVTGLNIDSVALPVLFRQGNANLKPENSRSISTGIALSPPKYKNFTVTVDYWRIKLKDVIDDVSATTQLIRDEELLDGAVQKALAAGTPISQINLGSGTDAYQGNPQVRRAAVNTDDIARYNTFNSTRPAAQQRAAVGRVQSVVTDYVNLASREAEGMDLGVEWRVRDDKLGQFVFRGEWSWLLTYQTEDSPGAPKVDNIRRDGRTRYRGNASVTWRKGRWTTGWFTTYYGDYVDTGTATTEAVYEALGRPDYISTYVDSGGVRRWRYLVSDFFSHNAYVDYAIPRSRSKALLSNISLRLGITNVTDVEPPLADENFGYRRGAGTTARGRTFYGQFTKRF